MVTSGKSLSIHRGQNHGAGNQEGHPRDTRNDDPEDTRIDQQPAEIAGQLLDPQHRYHVFGPLPNPAIFVYRPDRRRHR
jgi:hypothetical protein